MMIAKHNRTSLLFGIPGIALQIGSRVMLTQVETASTSELIWFIVSVLGTILLIIGLAFYAKAKGYHWAFGFLGLISLIGIIILAVMPDKASNS